MSGSGEDIRRTHCSFVDLSGARLRLADTSTEVPSVYLHVEGGRANAGSDCVAHLDVELVVALRAALREWLRETRAGQRQRARRALGRK